MAFAPPSPPSRLARRDLMATSLLQVVHKRKLRDLIAALKRRGTSRSSTQAR